MRRLEVIVGRGSGQEIENATKTENVVEKVVEMSKTDERMEEWEKTRQEAKMKPLVDRRHRIFWRRNKTIPARFEEMVRPRTPRRH